jgi:heme exporter protein B
MWRDAWLVCRKDLRLELRSRVATLHVVPFVFIVVMLFGFALDANDTVMRLAAPGLFWVAVIFAALLMIQRSAMVDRVDGLTDALKLSGLSATGIFLGKTAALFAQLVAIEVVLGVAVVVFLGQSLGGAALLAGSVATATIAIAAVGSIYGPLAASMSGRETVLPLLLLPVLAPVLLCATRAASIALGDGIGRGWPWVAMLAMLGGTYLLIGAATSGPLLEET